MNKLNDCWNIWELVGIKKPFSISQEKGLKSWPFEWPQACFVLHAHLTGWILKVTPSYSWRSLLSRKKNNLQWWRQRRQMICRVHISMRSSHFLLILYCSSCVTEMIPRIWTRNAIGNDFVPLNTRSHLIMIFRSSPKLSGNSDMRESLNIFC